MGVGIGGIEKRKQGKREMEKDKYKKIKRNLCKS